MDMNEISQLEINLLMLYYTYSDQYGKVDMEKVAVIAAEKMGVYIPPTQFILDQTHIDALMDLCMLPDTRELLTVVKLEPPKIIAKRIRKKKEE